MRCLNEYRLRATYSAVAEVVYGSRSNAHNVNRLLGRPRPLSSWIVFLHGTPSAFHKKEDLHPDLEHYDHVIDSGTELKALLIAYQLGIGRNQ